MKISILVTCFNSEKYIARCLNSVLNQTYKNTEILIYNDGSTDKTIEILEKYKKLNKNIKIFNEQNNKGVVFARNTLIDNCTGDLISYVDADDTIETDRSEMFVKAFLKDKNLLLCGSNFNFFYNNKLIWKSNIPLLQKDIVKLGIHNSFLGAGICYKNKKITKSIKFREIFNKKSYEDVDLILRISEIGNFRNLKKPLYNYHITSEQLNKKIDRYDPSVFYMKDFALYLFEQRKNKEIDIVDSNDQKLVKSYLNKKILEYSPSIYEYKYKISLYLRVLDRRNALKKIFQLILKYPFNKITLLLIARYMLSYFRFFTLKLMKL